MAIGVPCRSFYRAKVMTANAKRGRKTSPPNKLSSQERKEVVDLLLNQETIDLSPREIYYKILDEDQKIIASPSTFYRIAKTDNLLTKRAKTEHKPINREKPHLAATGPNQIWSWDVTQIRTDYRNIRFYLYVIIDIWSRYITGWKLEEREQTEEAIKMWKEALEFQGISGNGLINHKDNGSIMTAHEMIKFVRDAQMIDSYSRSGVSDDNPYSEALFRTIKYFRDFPDRFSTIEDARTYFKKYFDDYNHEHRHSRIQFMAPANRHFGEEERILLARNEIIKNFYNENPSRYSGKYKVFLPITVVRIN